MLGSHYSDIFAFIVLIVMLTLRPVGPAGRARGRPGLKESDMMDFINRQNKLRRPGRAGAVALLSLPLVAADRGNAWVRIVDIALLYVLLALGLNIVVGYAGLLDLGYVAFYAVGAYMFGLLASPHLTENFPAIAAMFPEGCTCRCGS